VISSVKTLDSFLVEEALHLGTYQGGIESVAQQCLPFTSLSSEKVNLLLNLTLKIHELKQKGDWTVKDFDLRKIMNSYKCGDPDKIPPLDKYFSSLVSRDVRTQLKDIDKHFNEHLMFRRNEMMAEKIDGLLKNDRHRNNASSRLFFAVGAGHLRRTKSLIYYLRKKGYNLTHVKYTEDIPITIQRRKEEEEEARKAKIRYNQYNWTDHHWEPVFKNLPKGKPQPPPAVVHIHKTIEKKYVYYYNSAATRKYQISWELLILYVLAWILGTQVT